MSGGRVEVGLGAGWNVPEIENHGTPFSERFGVMRERAEAMKAIWTEDEATYHGRHVNFDRITSWPKPVQKPHPPLWIGGAGEKVIDRVLRYGDGWFPNTRERLAERIAELRRRGEEAGRGRIPVTHFGTPIDAAVVEELDAAGVDRVLFMLPSAGADGDGTRGRRGGGDRRVAPHLKQARRRPHPIGRSSDIAVDGLNVDGPGPITGPTCPYVRAVCPAGSGAGGRHADSRMRREISQPSSRCLRSS